jgi:hypothetical protein
MVFNIGNQSGGVVNNVGRDQVVHGGQYGVSVTREDALDAVAVLRSLLASADLPGLTDEDRATVEEDVGVIAGDLASDAPDREGVRSRLERVTEVLTRAGAVAGAGAALVGPLTTIAQWLGPLGASVLRMLPV